MSSTQRQASTSTSTTNCDTGRTSESDLPLRSPLLKSDGVFTNCTVSSNMPSNEAPPHHVVCAMEKLLPSDEATTATTTTTQQPATPLPQVKTKGKKVSALKRRVTVTLSLPVLVVVGLVVVLLLAILVLLVYLGTQQTLLASMQPWTCAPWPDKGDDVKKMWNVCVNYSKTHDLCYPPPTSPCIPQYPDDTLSELGGIRNTRVPRLEAFLVPRLYTLTLQTHIHMNETEGFFFNGSVRILVECVQETTTFQINVLQLNVSQEGIVARDLASGALLTLVTMEYDQMMQWFSITLNGTLRKGHNYEIVFPQFAGKLRKTLVGYYLSDYEENGERRYLATSQLQPTDARRVFPCFDEPGLKAKFQVTLIRHKDFHSLTNMPLERTDVLDATWRADVHQTSLTMSTYLLGFVVSQFKNLTAYDSKNRRFSVWCRPELIHTANYTLHIGIRILEFFEEFFEIHYPLNKTDMVAVPDFQAGAMENWGVIIYREMTMLWDPIKSTEDSKQKVAVVVSHEIAHQWFGNLVTLKWWDDLWLNEGFASFVEYLGVAKIHPNWNMDDQFVSSELLAVMSLDSSPTTHPVQMTVFDPEEISSIFDSISYNKGASIIRMMEQFLGVGIFQRGLKMYLSRHKYNNTVYDDLWDSLADQASSENRSINLKEIMDVWIKQTGYPMVMVHRISPTEVALSQEVFMTKTHSKLSANLSSSVWRIPITYTDKTSQEWNATDRVFWLNTVNATMRLLDTTKTQDWFIFNLRRAGVYRVNYDPENWELIIDQLIHDHKVIPAIHRASLFDDLFNFARNGLVNYSLFLRMGEYLKKEREFVPWQTALRTITYLDALMATQAYYGFYVEYVKDIMEPVYLELGWDNRADDDHLVKMLRPLVVTTLCHVGHDKCTREALSRFRDWQKNPKVNNTMDSLMGVVFCQGIRNGDSSDWNELYEKTRVMPNNYDVIRALKGLGCTRDPWTLKLYLNMMLFGRRFSVTEQAEVGMAILKNPLGEYVIWELLAGHSQNVTNGAVTILSNSQHASNHFVKNKYHINQLVDLRQNWRRLLFPLNPRVLDQLIETGKQNLYWMETHSRAVADWLSQKYPYKSSINSNTNSNHSNSNKLDDEVSLGM